MAQIEVPRLVTKRRGAKTYHYWNPSEPLRKAGWKAEALGQDEAAAMARCRLLNNRLDQWRTGGARPAAVKAMAQQGSMAQLIAAYEAQAMPASANTAREYRTKLRIIADWAGHLLIAKVDRAAAWNRRSTHHLLTEAREVLADAEGLIGDMSRFASMMSLRDYAAFNEVPVRISALLARIDAEEP